MTDLPVVTLCADELLHGWSPRRIGSRVLVLGECTSTNDVAFDTAAAGPADGLIVLADHQTAGRGRHGRVWRSPRAASILCSIAIELPTGKEHLQGSDDRPSRQAGASGNLQNRHYQNAESPERDPQTIAGRFTLAAAVATCEAVRAASDLEPAIKWPNDVRINRRKLAGILIESRTLPPVRGESGDHRTRPGGERRVWVIGIGVNCLQQAVHFPPELRETATSLEIESHAPVDRPALARALLKRLDAWLSAIVPHTPAPVEQEAAAQALHAAWLAFSEPLGGYVRLRSGGREYGGRIVSVDPAGGLIVQVDERGPVWFDPMQTQLL